MEILAFGIPSFEKKIASVSYELRLNTLAERTFLLRMRNLRFRNTCKVSIEVKVINVWHNDSQAVDCVRETFSLALTLGGIYQEMYTVWNKVKRTRFKLCTIYSHDRAGNYEK